MDHLPFESNAVLLPVSSDLQEPLSPTDIASGVYQDPLLHTYQDVMAHWVGTEPDTLLPIGATLVISEAELAPSPPAIAPLTEVDIAFDGIAPLTKLSDSLLNGGQSPELSPTAVLEAAIAIVTTQLQAFQAQANATAQLEIAFGVSGNSTAAEQLMTQWLEGRDRPQIATISQGLIGSQGAYAAANNTIYLAQETLNTATSSELATLYLEELGHALDAQLNTVDSTGDEGAIFAALVQGRSLNAEQLSQLKAENDHGHITLNGETLAVEYNNEVLNNGGFENDLSGWGTFTGAETVVTDGAAAGGKALQLSSHGSGVSQITYEVVAGETYRFSSQIRTDDSGSSTFFGVRFMDASWQVLDSDQTIITSTDWTEYAFERVAPEGVSHVDIWAWKGSDTGNTYLDAISFAQVLPPSGPDTEAPIATVIAESLETQSQQPYDFTVTYEDPSAVDLNTLDNADIQVTGPNNFTQLATFVTATPSSDNTTITATYRLTAPSGTWNSDANGTYTLTLAADQIADTVGNLAATTVLGTFDVDIAPKTGNDVIINGGFENDLSGWGTFTGAETVVTDSSVAAGSKALQLSSNGSGVSQISYDLIAGETYRFSSQVKTDDPNSSTFFGVRLMDENWQVLNSDQTIITNTDWTEYALELVAPEGVSHVDVWAWKGSDTGNTYIDAIALQQLAPPDPEPEPDSTVSLKNSDTIFVNEATGDVTVTVLRTGDVDGRLVVEYTTNELGGAEDAQAGNDYTTPTLDDRANTGEVVFEAGETEATITIPIINDDQFEGNESFAIGLQNPSVGDLGTPRTQLITILDDDEPATIALNQNALNIAESGSLATLTVQRSGDISAAASVSFRTIADTATADQDYTATSGVLNFAAGQTSQTIEIAIADDTLTEGNEAFSVVLENPTGAALGEQTTTAVTILDNDLDLGALEREVFLDSGLTQPTTLDWTPNGDYMLVAEKAGAVKVIARDGTITTVIDLSAQVNGTRDRGLLGLTVHPDFENTPFLYLLHTYDPPETANHTGLGGADGNGNRPSRLVRVTVDPNTMIADPDSLVVIAGSNSTWDNTSQPTGDSTGKVDIDPSGIVNGTTITATADQIDVGSQDNNPNLAGVQNQNIRDYLATDSQSHTIGDLEFGADGYLYLSNGDGTSYNFMDPRGVRVQDVHNLSGKVLKIDPLTGEGAESNPFHTGDGASNASKVYYSGLRNPFRFAIDPLTDRPVIGDVGWSKREEINTGAPGSNFGWPYFEGDQKTGGYQGLGTAIAFYNNGNRNNPGDDTAVFPILSRSHGAPDNANAIMVGDFYNSDTLMFGDINGGTLYAATLDSDRQVTNVQVFDSGVPYLVDMKMGPDGFLYGVNLAFNQILRWEPQTPIGPLPDATEDLDLNFTEFADLSSLDVNGNAASVDNKLRLTPATQNQAGSTFGQEALEVDADTSFSTQFSFQLSGGQGSNGADGFTFTLQNTADGSQALGPRGGDLGYGGLNRSLAIEFDTYNNGGELNKNHVSLLRDGDVESALATSNSPFDLNGGTALTAWIDYDGATDLLSVYLADGDAKPATALFSETVDLASILGAQAYVGFTAGTGGLVNNQDILSWSFAGRN